MASTGTLETAPEVHVIASPEEAIEVARQVADQLREGADLRDRSQQLPEAELDLIRQSGLLGIMVPTEYGGIGASHIVLSEVFQILAAADPGVTQIPQPHFSFVDLIVRAGNEEQREFFLGEALAGKRFGNALSERGTKSPGEYNTSLSRQGDGSWLLNGTKYYSTGALQADWVAVLGITEEGDYRFAYVPGNAEGFEVSQDWTAFGQRSTISGTTTIEDVVVEDFQLIDMGIDDRNEAQTTGAHPQLLHGSIDIGIARGALEEGIRFTREKARPWPDAGVDRATEDEHIQLHFGRLQTHVHAAEALIREAGQFMDLARDEPTQENIVEARLRVAEAKAFGGDTALEVTTALFDGSGSSAVDGKHGLDRHWRNARVHTLHDPNRWKYIHLGNYLLNDVPPAASNHVI